MSVARRVGLGRASRGVRRARYAAPLVFALLTMTAAATPIHAGSSGNVDADVTVSAAAACLEIDVTSVSFGTLGLGASGVATPNISVTNCGDSAGTLLASGTDATGTNATWSLVDSTSTCADTLGVNNYHLGLTTDVPGITWLGTANKELLSLPAGIGLVQDAEIRTACPGSSGAGTTMSMTINYAITGDGTPPPPALEPLPDTQANADAAVAYLVGGTRDFDVSATCSGTILVACTGGVPSDPLPQIESVAATASASRVIDTDPWTASATLAVHTLQPIPVSSLGVSCTASYDSSGGSVSTLQLTGTLTFLSTPDPTGPTNYIAVSNVQLSGIEDADIQIGGGGTCDLVTGFLPYFHDYLVALFQSYLQGNICGAPDPDTFMPCPAF
jgi:hypothetical protein